MDCDSKSFQSLATLYEVKINSLYNSNSKDYENGIRQELCEALEIMEQMYPFFEYDVSNKYLYSSSFYNLPIISYRKMNELEIQFVLKKIKDWIEKGFKEAKKQLVHLAILDLIDADRTNKKLALNDRELVSIVEEYSPNYIERLSGYLYNDAVRELFLQKYKEPLQNDRCAFYLGKFYYEQEKYTVSFKILKNIKGENFYKKKCSYLGLMYYYGYGVNKDWTQAKYYLEQVIEGACAYDAEIVCALGEIYEQKVSLKKALEFYEKVLRDASYKEKPYFSIPIIKYLDLKGKTTKGDRIIMTVEISSKNLKCEFSVELPQHAKVIVDWGDCSNKFTATPTNNESKIITFQHKYHKPGIYKINIETLCARTLEGLDFPRYKNQLKSIHFERTLGIRRISIIGQKLKSLKLPKSRFLNGLVCRSNKIKKLDLKFHPQLTHLDCSFNPLNELLLAPVMAISAVCLRGTKIPRKDLNGILKLYQESFVNPILYNDLEEEYKPLGFYFRLTNWRKVKEYMKKEKSFAHYSNGLNYKELETVFNRLKRLSNNKNQTPYQKGYLEIYDSFICDNTIIGAEEFYITEKEWTTCLATRIRNCKLCEPWLGVEPPTPEYYVANCLPNMMNNKAEMKKYCDI